MGASSRKNGSIRPGNHFAIFRIIELMNHDLRDIFKALGSDVRLQMLYWLKDPARHFPEPVAERDSYAGPLPPVPPDAGVCVGYLQRKAGISPSTASAHLAVLQRAGLIEATRVGQWTYYRRNDARIVELARAIEVHL